MVNKFYQIFNTFAIIFLKYTVYKSPIFFNTMISLQMKVNQVIQNHCM